MSTTTTSRTASVVAKELSEAAAMLVELNEAQAKRATKKRAVQIERLNEAIDLLRAEAALLAPKRYTDEELAEAARMRTEEGASWQLIANRLEIKSENYFSRCVRERFPEAAKIARAIVTVTRETPETADSQAVAA